MECTPWRTVTSKRVTASGGTSLVPTHTTCMPGSSQSASNTGTPELVQVATISAPAIAACAASTGSTAMPSRSLILAA